MRQCRREGTAKDPNSSKVHRREGKFSALQKKPVILTLLLCTSAELFSHQGSEPQAKAV